MKKIIRKKVFDTETGTIIKKYTFGCFGDPAGFEETLFQTPEGQYFLYVNGGITSPYPSEDILHLAKAKVSSWLDAH